MARGTANNEPVVSQAGTKAYRENYPLSGQVQRGRWVWDAEQGRLVDAASYVPPSEAKDAPIMSGRFYEDAGPSPIDGSEINSRKKHREHMRRHGVTAHSDFKGEWAKAAAKREQQRKEGRIKVKGLRESIERRLYQLHKP